MEILELIYHFAKEKHIDLLEKIIKKEYFQPATQEIVIDRRKPSFIISFC